MEEKNTVVFEYHPNQDVGQISFIWEENNVNNLGWRNLGIFYGTMMEAIDELERRIELFNKYSFYEIKWLN